MLTRPDKPESKFLEALGHKLHYLAMGDGEGIPIVFLHGGGPGCTGWSDFGVCAPHMDRRKLYLFDLLQYGLSDKPDIDGPVWSTHAAIYADAIRTLGLERAHLVCNSWGGAGALAMGIEHPDVVASLVITGSMPVQRGPFGPLIDHSWRGRFARLDYYGGDGPTWEKMRALIARFEWYDQSKIPDETVTMRYEQSLDPGEMRLGLAIDERGTMQDIGSRLGEIEAPTLFVWGMEDDFLGPEYPLSLAAAMQRGNLVVMDRSSHHLQEERPLEYALAVNAFLDRVEEVGA